MEKYISFQDVRKVYTNGEVETTALDNASFHIRRGEFCVVVGPSGAGKTTLLNILGGMDTATSGRVSVDREDISTLSAKQLTQYRRHHVGFVFQFYNLVPNLTALENVELASELCDDPLDAERMLHSVGLKSRLHHFPSQLSGGEQQRVAIARALAKNPKLLLCDEPTGALDDETGRQILSLLQQMSAKTGMTVVLITHNSAIAQIAQRVIKMRDGRVDRMGLMKNPKAVRDISW